MRKCRDCGCWKEQMNTDKVLCLKYGQLVDINQFCLDDEDLDVPEEKKGNG